MKDELIGKTFYKFDIVDNEAVLKTFTLKEKSNEYPDSVRDYYEYEEGDKYSFYQTHPKSITRVLCSKYIEVEVFEDVRKAAQVIWDRYEYMRQKEKNNSLYVKKIVHSKVFQDTLDKHPSILI